MRPRAALVLVLLLAAVSALAQDPLADGDKAFRKADFESAARFYAAAAEAETDPAKRADIRVRLAVADFNLKRRTKAEEALAAALKDAPALELVPDFYDPAFLKLFARVKARLAAEPTPTPAPGPTRGAGAGSLAQIRQRLAQATDNAGVEAVLPAIEALAASAPTATLPDVLDVKAEAFERLGRTPDALDARGRAAALRAIAQAPAGTSPVPLEALLDARRLLAAGRPLDGIALLHGVLDALPSCTPALEVLAEAYLDAGKLDEAYNALRTALLGNVKPDLLLELGEVELRRGHLPGARDAFRRVVELDAGNDRAWAALGLLAAHMGDLGSAREELDKALAANGTLFEARVVRAQTALADGQAAVALQHLQRALQVKPDDPWANGWLGATYLMAGNAAVAAEKLQAAIKADQGQFYLALAEALRRLGRTDEALQALAAAKPDEPKTSLLRARCLVDAGRPSEAEGVLRTLIQLFPDNAEAHYLLGAALHAQRRWTDAGKELEQAAQLKGAPAGVKDAILATNATARAQALLDSALTPPTMPPPR